jgi:large subunit ribosomal protein L30
MATKKKNDVLYINGKYIVKSDKPLHNANFKKGERPYEISNKRVQVTLVKSPIASLEIHKKTVEALGLKKIRDTKVFNDSPALRGMLFRVRHMVEVQEL